MPDVTPQRFALSLPVAIVFAGALVAGAVVISNTDFSARPSVPGDVFTGAPNLSETVRPVTDEDWIAGNPLGTVSIIEYSDFECPFCARFHPTMERIIAEFPNVRWVYRHFPLSSIHPEAVPSGLAAECVGVLKGDTAFFTFVRALFLSQNNLGSALYEREAQKLGVSSEELKKCLANPAIADAVDADLGEAIASGGTGTPYSLVVSASGRFFPINGALDYEQVKAVIKAAHQ